jgi:hypothetical protein
MSATTLDVANCPQNRQDIPLHILRHTLGQFYVEEQEYGLRLDSQARKALSSAALVSKKWNNEANFYLRRSISAHVFFALVTNQGTSKLQKYPWKEGKVRVSFFFGYIHRGDQALKSCLSSSSTAFFHLKILTLSNDSYASSIPSIAFAR